MSASTDTPVFFFVVPDPGDVVSGGHLYNARMIAELRATGADVQRLDLDAAAAAMPANDSAVFVFDSLHVGAKELAELPLESHRCYLLAHHLQSLLPEDGRTSDEVFEADEAPALARFHGVWTTSAFTADYLATRGIDTDRIVTIEPACDELTLAHPDPDAPPRLLVVANLIARKNVLALLDEVAGHSDLPTFDLRIIGGDDLEPDYAASCRARVEEDSGLREHVTFTGQLDATAMPAEYAHADLLLSVATMETFGMAVREAITAGVPVLLIDAGFGRRHFATGGAGQAFDTVADLVAALLELLEDESRLQFLGEAARELRPPPRVWQSAAAELLACLDK